MRINEKISVLIPGTNDIPRYFSFKLKKEMYNERCEHLRPGKMVAISDVAGNFQVLCKLLRNTKVIDENFHWIFGDNHLVIIGDCFSQDKEFMECLWLIYSLEEKAKREGGYVHFVLGNHEIMNFNGDWRHLHPRYAKRKSGSSTALYDGNNELWRWLCTKNVIEKVGDILFVHAGIANELLQLGLSVSQINSLAKLYYTRTNERNTDPIISIIYDTATSPFWYDGYYLGVTSEEQVDATLKHFGVNTIVTGHTMISKIDTFYNGKVVNINTDHTSNSSEALLISKHRYYRITINGTKERIK